MTPLPKHLIAYNKDLPGPVIITTTPPFLYGKIWQETDSLQFMAWCNGYKGLGYHAIPGYNIAIYVGGTIKSNIMHTDRLDIANQIAEELKEMADFYIDNKINMNLSRFKRFRTAK